MTTTPTSPRFLSYSPPDVRWGWWDVIYGIAAFFLTVTLQIAAVVMLDLGPDDADAFGFITGIVTYAALVAVVVVASQRRGLKSLAADFGVRFRWIDLPLGLAAGLAAKVFTLVLTAVAVLLTDHTPEQGNFTLSDQSLWVVLNGILIASLVAPFVEELFFRGLVLRAARNRVLRRGGSPVRAVVVAIAVSSVGFALLHLLQSTDVTLLIILGGSTLALGVINSVLAIATGRIGAAVISHVFYNGSSIVLALLLSQS
jgi:uncharacterized protein